MIGGLRTRLVQILSIALLLVAWYTAALPSESSSENARLAQRFSFAKVALNGTGPQRIARPVAPAYQHIQHWISAVGAAVALADVDGNGRADDVCLVDPRDDSVTLAPAPGTGRRMPPIRLTPAGLPYDATMAPMVCTPGDFNEDGRTDLLVSYWGRSPVLFLRTPVALGDPGAFTAQELVRPSQVWNTDAVSVADVDGDGHSDIIVGNYFPDRARVLDVHARQRELVMQRSMSAAYNGGPNRVLLWRSGQGGARPSASYTEVPEPFGDREGQGWTLAVGAQDLDRDGLPELYFANDFGPDRLFQNLSRPGRVRFRLVQGRRHLTTPKSKVLGKDSFKGMGVAFADLNGDTVPDMLVSNITETYGLLESNFAWMSRGRRILRGDVVEYDDHSEPLGLSRSGWGWDIKAGDFAGDGSTQIVQATGFVKGRVDRWPQLQELAMTNDDLLAHPAMWPDFRPGEDDVSGDDHDPFFVRGTDGRYHDISARLGVDDSSVTRGIGLADIDHDGRLDYAIANQWGRSYLFRNTRTNRPPYLGLRLVRPAGGCAAGTARPAGTGTPGTAGTAGGGAVTPAVGAAAELHGGTKGVRVGQVYPTNGHAGASSPELLFGLERGTASVPVTLSWRDACGVRRTGDVRPTPGWHTLLLNSDGSIREMTP
ncbi:FG-GAP repeat domain-containing protein [Actinomadura xylanilytica]|uniref:FG-GAP repeat domain-containing protein n=1 Tax=Actinomadura xylanilytica TaxID=887459 RepID=UPI00255AAC5B|nr:VCBS repeat-containing protein [Actinomadura xylanilytica]MDL4776722.1 VCBS repeat-containing protein [Actinomadura xylanilytica]